MLSTTHPYIDLAWFEQAQKESIHLECISQNNLEVFEHDRHRWICFHDGAIQSMISLDDHSYPVLHYVKALLCSLVFVQQPKNLLNLGLGSGAIERFMLMWHPEVHVISIEPEADMIAVSKECFFLEADYPVREETAQTFFSENKLQFDIIICDIHPEMGEKNPIQNDIFIDRIIKSLTPKGIAAINFLPENEDDIVRMLLRLRHSFSWVTVFDVPAQQNVVLYCSNSQLPDKTDLCFRSKQPDFNSLEAEAICSQLIWLPK
ncbi:MAG: hypothetical protein ABW139_03290 [Candidatus Thiodiazotropha sp. DIVDIV]